jgi:hypothetical protein
MICCAFFIRHVSAMVCVLTNHTLQSFSIKYFIQVI